MDFVHNAILWSGLFSCRFDEKMFDEFLRAYKDNGGCIYDNIETALYGSLQIWMDWMIYNMEKCLDRHDVRDGIEFMESKNTLQRVLLYSANIQQWANQIAKVFSPHSYRL